MLVSFLEPMVFFFLGEVRGPVHGVGANGHKLRSEKIPSMQAFPSTLRSLIGNIRENPQRSGQRLWHHPHHNTWSSSLPDDILSVF